LKLFKSCLGIQKIVYIIRTSPSFHFPEGLQRLDEQIRKTLSKILNLNLNDNQWKQASLPVKYGGLGIRSVKDLALPCFISSVQSCSEYAEELSQCEQLEEATQIYYQRLGMQDEDIIDQSKKTQQSVWDEPIIKMTWDDVVQQQPEQVHRLKACTLKESGAWLNIRPSDDLDTRLSDEELTAAAALRLGVEFCEPHSCALCGDRVDSFATHGISCVRGPHRRAKHDEINRLTAAAFRRAQITATVEPTGLNRTDGKRPDGVTTMPFTNGKRVIWDVTCPDTFAMSNVSKARAEVGRVAETAAKNKETKYAELSCRPEYSFVPIAIETSGVMCRKARDLIAEIGRLEVKISGNTQARCWLEQRLSLALQRGNARSMLATIPWKD
jgi:hypothetical protein